MLPILLAAPMPEMLTIKNGSRQPKTPKGTGRATGNEIRETLSAFTLVLQKTCTVIQTCLAIQWSSRPF